MLHVFKHSKFISHAMASRHPGETEKKRNRSRSPREPALRKHESRPMVRPHRSGSRNLSLLSPGRFYTASGAVIPHGITACTGPRGHTVFQIGDACRKRTRGRGLRCHAGHAGSSAPGLLTGGTKERRTTGREKKISAARASWSGTCPPTV